MFSHMIATLRLNRVSVAGHASLVLIDKRLAVCGRVRSLGEEHALIPLGLFFLAYAARL